MELAADGIVLRSWREDDIPAIHAACQDPEIQRWIPLIPRPYELEHARAFVADELGLGRALMAAAEGWLRERGAPAVRLMVREENAEACSFYRAIGYETQRVATLGKRLGSDQP